MCELLREGWKSSVRFHQRVPWDDAEVRARRAEKELRQERAEVRKPGKGAALGALGKTP